MQRSSLRYLGFATLFTLMVASCILLDVPLFHDSRLMSKWFGFYATVLVLSASLFGWSYTRRTSIRVVDLAVMAFAAYILIYDYCRGDLDEMLLLRWLSLLLLYLIFRQPIDDKLLDICLAVCFGLALAAAGWGIVQFAHAVTHGDSLSTAVVGNFDNPAGYALTLSLSLPIGIHLLRFSQRFGSQRFCIAIALGFVVLSLVLSLSRTGWLSLLCIGIYALLIWGKRRRLCIGLIIGVAVLVFIVCCLYKQDSTDGRSFVALCTWQQITDFPWWGHGRYGFSAEYMKYQAGYLTLHPDSRFAWLADNIHHPFSEWLYLCVRYGIVGCILLIGILLCLIPAIKYKVAEKSFLPIGLLVAILPFTLFSYPLQYPLAWMMLMISLGMLARHTKEIFHISVRRLIPALSLLLACGIAPLLYRSIYAELEWYDVATRSLSGQTRYVMPRYEELYKHLKDSPHFLYNYAAELNYIGEYTRSQQILDECMLKMNDYDTHLLAASNHENMGNFGLAEDYLNKASAMCPVRFVPLYQLTKIYGKMGRYDDQRRMAQQIIDKEEKVPSLRIADIKEEMRHLLEKTSFK